MISRYTSHIVDEEKIQNDPVFGNLYYCEAGFYKYAVSHALERKNPDFYMMLLCTGGEGYVCCGKDRYTVRAGDVFFCFPHTYTAYGSSLNMPWSLYWIHFKGEAAEKHLKSSGITEQSPVIHLHNGGFNKHYRKILDTGTNNGALNALYEGQSNFYNLLFGFLNRNDVAATGVSGMVEKTIRYIGRNLHKKLTLDELAAQANLSKFHFARLFAQETGCSPMRYLQNTRIEQAKSLLLSTNGLLSEVAELLGFDDVYYFSAVFKKVTGLSPGRYRRKNQFRGSGEDF